MSFNRKQYSDIYDFAELVHMRTRNKDLKVGAERIMDWCEDVIGQLRSGDEPRRNSGRFSDVESRRPQ
jgi:hypothetical protein